MDNYLPRKQISGCHKLKHNWKESTIALSFHGPKPKSKIHQQQLKHTFPPSN